MASFDKMLLRRTANQVGVVFVGAGGVELVIGDSKTLPAVALAVVGVIFILIACYRR